MKARIKVEFLMNFSPDKAGKCTSEIKFSLPEAPGIPVPDELKRAALNHAGMLCAAVLQHPDGFPS